VIAAGVAASERLTAARTALLAVAMGLQCAGGQPEPVLATLVVGAAVSLARRDGGRWARTGHVAAAWLAGGAWAFLLAAPQLLPGLIAARSTLRSLGFTAEGFLYNSLDPRALPGLFVPRWGGSPFDRLAGGFPGGEWTDSGTPYLVSHYAGLATLGLAVLGVVAALRRREGRGLALALTVTGVLGVALALGRHVPGAVALVQAIPLHFPLRYPVKALFVTFLALPALAALGVEDVRRRFGRWAALAAAGVVVLDLGLAHRGFAPTIEPAELDEPPLARDLQSRSAAIAPPGTWRLHHERRPEGEWGAPAGSLAPTEQAVHAWRRRMLMPPTAAPHGILAAMEPSGDLLDDLGYFATVKDAYGLRDAPSRWAERIGQAGVLWVVSPSPDLEARTAGALRLERPLGGIDGVPAGSGWLYRDLHFVPRFTLASSPAWPAPRELRALGSVDLVAQDPAGLELHVAARADAWVVVSDATGPLDAWEVRVDGAPVSPRRAGSAFYAFPVAAGPHAVRVDYLAPGLFAGCALALLGAVAAFAVLSMARAQLDD
jgi:hypothetical protein